jgi:hypothetical protein
MATHHMFHRTARLPWMPASTDTAITLAYILGLAFVVCMFLCMATEWDLQSVLFFCCGGFAVIAMAASAVLRNIFEEALVNRMHAFKREGESVRSTYTPLPTHSLMPRLSVFDFTGAH